MTNGKKTEEELRTANQEVATQAAGEGIDLATLLDNVRSSAAALPAPGAAGVDPYTQALSTFGTFTELGTFAPSAPFAQQNPELLSVPGASYTTETFNTNESGWMLFPNNVIAIPGERVLYGKAETDAEVEGSLAWLTNARESWSKATILKWRKKLWEQGFVGAEMLQAEKGGWAQDLSDALRAYWNNYYLNGAKAVPLIPPEGVVARQQLRKSTDVMALKEEVKAWGQVPFGEDLTDDEATYFADLAMDLAVKLMKRKDFTPEQALMGGKLRAQKQFTEDPLVKANLSEEKLSVAGVDPAFSDQEVSYKLRDNILSTAQLLSA